jgi:hypothetical protein
MAQKANYKFERMERDRAKAAKVAEKAAAKQRDREEAAARASDANEPPKGD